MLSFNERNFGFKTSKKVVSTALILGVSVALSGCSISDSNDKNSESKTTNAQASAQTAPSYGSVTGSGEKIETSDGSYEKIELDKQSSLYEYNNGDGHPEYMSVDGWTEEDGKTTQRMALDFVIEEYIDSSTLEGDAKTYKTWYETSAKKYFNPIVLKEEGLKDGSAQIILGSSTGVNAMPKLIHDGKPRVKSLKLDISGFGPYSDDEGYKGIEFTIMYKVEYRVDDANAVKFAALHRGKGVTEKEFLKSDEIIKIQNDEVNENVYSAKGSMNIVLDKDKNGDFKILGLDASDSEYDVRSLFK